jgi:hypothetical protein
MNSIITPKIILFIVVTAIFISGESRNSFASAEWVYVEKVLSNDNNGIIVRANGDAYQIEKGTGCISFWQYEGKRVLVSSPGIFLGVGCELILPDVDQKCRIWDSKFLGQWSSSTPKSSSGSSHNAVSKDEIKIIQIALKTLGHYSGDPDGIMGDITKKALKKFQKSNELEESGSVDADSALSLSKKITKMFPNNSDALNLSIALLNIAKRRINGTIGTPSTNYSTGCDSGHWVSSISNGGEIVILEDGSVWQVDSIDTIDTSLWLPTEEITVCNGNTMINTDNSDKVGVSKLK